jgi:hypothetical protein
LRASSASSASGLLDLADAIEPANASVICVPIEAICTTGAPSCR